MDTSRGLLDTLDTNGLNTALSEATCLGIQVEPANARLRLELDVLTLPLDGPPPADCAVFLTLSGVSRVAASFRRQQWDDLEPEILPATLETLGDAVRSFGGGALHGWEFFDLDDSSWALWRELLSFDTVLGAGEGAHIFEFSQEEGIDPRELDIRVWFDRVSIQDCHGHEIPVADFIAGGMRWWEAHDRCDPRTMRPDIVPAL
ncbi:hypothetical protein IU501_23505 [Nocardia otitidiscaviarum]|uniref:Uncharacterized protein n=1 Tax=Nocardia otitidiscaviarum TaxID=1823 RepID=A0A378YCC0_9NOCA|nr:hypothetical protein [Nocardia otitidiscaviarum]MBF6135963.1 hypothetical protein [Nocardia otitidiscaviarum]MBF6238006.1 hypothetical protein [Nocardia otitidiscaviarum]MBF6483718.1 hypothetical protein [Nocardia otitidiscaviarum]SUA74872.1 Uncharacterised protein [Nocardia otitidiscaviarum]